MCKILQDPVKKCPREEAQRLRRRRERRLLPLSFIVVVLSDMFWQHFWSFWLAACRSVSCVVRYDVPGGWRVFPETGLHLPASRSGASRQVKWAGLMFTTGSGSRYDPDFPKLASVLLESLEWADRLLIWARRSRCCCSCCCGWCCGVTGWAWPWAGNARPDSRTEPECPRTPDCWPVGRRQWRCCRGRPSPTGPRRTGRQQANVTINHQQINTVRHLLIERSRLRTQMSSCVMTTLPLRQARWSALRPSASPHVSLTCWRLPWARSRTTARRSSSAVDLSSCWPRDSSLQGNDARKRRCSYLARIQRSRSSLRGQKTGSAWSIAIDTRYDGGEGQLDWRNKHKTRVHFF